jgi:hypothetical protein
VGAVVSGAVGTFERSFAYDSPLVTAYLPRNLNAAQSTGFTMSLFGLNFAIVDCTPTDGPNRRSAGMQGRTLNSSSVGWDLELRSEMHHQSARQWLTETVGCYSDWCCGHIVCQVFARLACADRSCGREQRTTWLDASDASRFELWSGACHCHYPGRWIGLRYDRLDSIYRDSLVPPVRGLGPQSAVPTVANCVSGCFLSALTYGGCPGRHGIDAECTHKFRLGIDHPEGFKLREHVDLASLVVGRNHVRKCQLAKRPPLSHAHHLAGSPARKSCIRTW